MTTAAGAWAALKARIVSATQASIADYELMLGDDDLTLGDDDLILTETTEATITIPLAFPNDGFVVSDTPSPFAFVAYEINPSFPAPVSFGAGRGNNRYRNSAFVTAYVFTPSGEGIEGGLAHAETIAARMRSFRDTDVSCFEATVEPGGPGSNIKPPGLTVELGNYYYCCAEISLIFDQIG